MPAHAYHEVVVLCDVIGQPENIQNQKAERVQSPPIVAKATPVQQ